MKSLQILKDLKIKQHKERYPSMPDHAIPQPKYSDKTANGLTRCIIDYLTLSGHFAERVNSMGRMIDGRKTYTDVIGQKKTIGSMKYIPSTGHVGTADIHSEINVNINGNKIPIAVKWEVKIGKDRQSEYQKTYESKVGNYFIVKTFDDFYQKYLDFINKYS
jgi:hypothetical protein